MMKKIFNRTNFVLFSIFTIIWIIFYIIGDNKKDSFSKGKLSIDSKYTIDQETIQEGNSSSESLTPSNQVNTNPQSHSSETIIFDNGWKSEIIENTSITELSQDSLNPNNVENATAQQNPNQEKNSKIQETMSELAKIDIPLPNNYNFSISETDDELLIASGFNPRDQSHLNFIAGRQIFGVSEAINLIKQEPDAVQIHSDYYQALENLQPYEKHKHPSFTNGEFHIYYGQDDTNNLSIAVVFGSRRDKQGSYMAIAFAPTEVLDSIESNLLHILEETKLHE